ncbi:TA system antitoxin ParD family protein [Oceanisphaera sp. IT1-181]|uniref:TA system antitoxin ParD family protein n=1 Tax=Oceanisphaera sp. IT1-181 TaxID=3081199 RepID=UPI0029C9B32B|nr:hypothetical protein [Oceanisphaera sp. IT1-181]
MAQSIRLDAEFVSDVKVHALVSHRSVPKQIEYWAKIGQMVEENPDLPFSFVKDALLATQEVKLGRVKPYVRRTKRD